MQSVRKDILNGYSVTIERYGEQVLTIEENCLSGKELSDEDEDGIYNMATHLLSFLGRTLPKEEYD